MGLYTSKESFLNPQHIALSGHEGMQALYRAEVIDSYRQRVELSAPNRIARKTLKYIPSLHTVAKLVTHSDNWPHGQVVWMDPDSDMGMPHTRPPNLICLPNTISDSSLTGTLLHERVHISQRLHPAEWKTLFASAWSMTPWSGDLPADILLRVRLNPDLILAPTFQWKGDWVPFAIFKSLTGPVLNDVDIVWWQSSTRVLHRQAPPGWVEFFGPVDSGHEHPYELSAYMIEKDNSSVAAYKALKPLLKGLPSSGL